MDQSLKLVCKLSFCMTSGMKLCHNQGIMDNTDLQSQTATTLLVLLPSQDHLRTQTSGNPNRLELVPATMLHSLAQSPHVNICIARNIASMSRHKQPINQRRWSYSFHFNNTNNHSSTHSIRIAMQTSASEWNRDYQETSSHTHASPTRSIHLQVCLGVFNIIHVGWRLL
eukprot:2764171-Amphidinium_carterae.1